MNRSGIKRGLAVSAVAALGVVGVPGMAHAADAASLGLTPASGTVVAYQYDTVTVKALDSSGAAATTPTTVHLTITESDPKGATDTSASPFDDDGTITGFTSAAASGGQWTETGDVTVPAGGTATFKLGSEIAGTVHIAAADGAITKSTSFSVTPGTDATSPADVKSLSLDSSSLSEYTGDWTADGADPFNFEALNASGNPLGNVTVNYEVTKSGSSTPVASDTIDIPAAAFSDTNPFVVPMDDLTSIITTAGTYTFKLWVNNAADGGTNGADAGEPTGTFTLTLTDAPAATAPDGLSTPTATNVGGTWELPADGKDTPTQASVTLVDGSGHPVSGAKVRFDVVITPPGGGSPIRTSIPATSDPSGVASVNPTLPAALDIAGTTISVHPFLSASSSTGVGTSLTAARTITVTKRNYALAFAGAGDHIQASKGGTVSVPVTIADQFGDIPQVTQSLGFSVTGANATSGQTIIQATNGQATYTYTDTKASVGTAQDTVHVNDLSTSGVAPLDLDVDYIAGSTTASKVTFTTDPTSGYASADLVPDKTVDPDYSSSAYTVHVVNADNEPLVNSKVTFSVDKGFVTDGTDAHKGSSITLYTDNSGDATVYLGSTAAGTQHLTVVDGSATASPKYGVTYEAAAPYSLTWSSAPTTIVPGQSAKYLVEITDEWGNPVEGESVDPAIADNTQPGTVDFFDSNFTSDANGIASVVVKTLETDSGTGTLTVKPGSWVPSGAAPATDGATAPYTDAKGISTTYTVEEPVVVTPPPAQPKITAFSGKSVRANDVLTVKVANGNGKRVNIVRGGKVIAHGAVKGGKVVFRVKDNNGNKVTRYVAKVAKSSKSTRVR